MFDKCPQCGSTRISETDDGCECSDCGWFGTYDELVYEEEDY
jgi:hypothetical protein